MSKGRRWIFCGLTAGVVAAGLSLALSVGRPAHSAPAPPPTVSVPAPYLA